MTEPQQPRGTPAVSIRGEDTQGVYVVQPGTPHYAVANGQLCAESGGIWYQLRAPQIDRGFVRGLPWVTNERWCVVGGSHVRSYYRMPDGFRNSDVAPEFVEE